MKQIYFIKTMMVGLIAGGVSSAIAQPTLTAANSSPALGDSIVYFILDSNATDYLSTAGAGVTWDYSNVAGYGTTTTQRIVDPATTPYVADFPSSQLCEELVGSGFIYRTNYPDSVVSEGYVVTDPTLGTVTIILTDNLRYIEYPFTYTDMFVDAIDGTADAPITGGTPIPYSGTMTVEADAHGTLTVGSTTMYNVLRIKNTENGVADAGIFGTIPIVRTQLWYYEPGTSNFPIFVHSTVSANGVTTSVVYSWVDADFHVGVEEQSAPEFSITPNPATDWMNLQLQSPQNGQVNLNVVSLTGKQVLDLGNRTVIKGSQTIRVNVETLAAGVYFVNARMGDAIQTKKLVIR